MTRRPTVKRFIIILAVIVLATALCAAPTSNEERERQLHARQSEIVVEIDGINAQQQALDAQRTALQTEYVKCQGGIEELERQDREAAEAKAEAAKEATKP